MAQAVVGIRNETRAKIESVARARRWTFAEAVDAVFDEHLERHPDEGPEHNQDPEPATTADSP